MTPEHLSPAQRELLAKAKAAQDGDFYTWVEFSKFANPAAVIDLLTQLGEARASRDDAMRGVAARPATAEGGTV
jgi:hypothetical protein